MPETFPRWLQGLADGQPHVATWKDHCVAFLRRRLVEPGQQPAAPRR